MDILKNEALKEIARAIIVTTKNQRTKIFSDLNFINKKKIIITNKNEKRIEIRDEDSSVCCGGAIPYGRVNPF
jgi:hypothetical protein